MRRSVKSKSIFKSGNLKRRFKRFIFSFKPSNFKAYWLNRGGLIRIGKIAGTFVLLIFLVFLYYAKDLPSPNKVNAAVSGSTTKFWDRTHQHLLYEVYGTKNRSVIDFDQMPTTIKQATVAVEDKNFYHHGAFSAFGIVRAALFDVIHRGAYQGGSTITQQLVKNALLTGDRRFSRKVKELILSIEIEQFYKKDDILKLYLNEIPYGNNSYGIQAAAKTYFDKDAKDLTLDESAFLAAIPRAPTYYSPYGENTAELATRKNVILDLMAQQKYITQAQANAAKQINTLAKVPAVPQYFANVQAPHFVFYVKEQLEFKYGVATVDEGGLDITTTIDYDKQQAAEAAIKKDINQVRALGGSNAALVAGDPKTGQVLAMVGSYDFSASEFNVATAERQPGSSFKPFVYATAWAQDNMGPGSTLYDVPTNFGGTPPYQPKNFTGRNYGVQSMRTALAGSLNIPAVKTMYIAGVSNAIDTAHKMGITTLNNDNYGLSLVLGSGEVKLVDMVNAYESFANGGVHYAQSDILKITNPKGKVLEQFKADSSPKRVLDPQVAYLMSNVLSDVPAKAFAFGSDTRYFSLPGRPVASKTGTTESYHDAWTMGYTPNLVGGVWAGNNDNKPMRAAAADVAAPLWHDFMLAATKDMPVEQFAKPDGIKQITLDSYTGKLPAAGQTAHLKTDIFPSWYKPATPDNTQAAKIDSVSGKLATNCTPPLAVQSVTISPMHAEIPASDPAYGRWDPPVQALAQKLGYTGGATLPTGNDDVHHCDDHKPTVNVIATDNNDGTWRIKATWSSGTFNINKLDISLDDQIVSTQAVSDPNGNYGFDQNIAGGGHTIKAVVTDAGLYQGDDSQNINASGGGGSSGFHNNSPSDSASRSAGLIHFSWSSDGPAVTYTLMIKKGSSTTPVPTGTSRNTDFALTPGNYTWYVVSGTDQTAAYSLTITP